MRTRAKVDGNQTKIVQTLHAIGASVTHLHALGKGVPDILVGWKGINYLIEIKDGSLPLSKQRLTKAEKEFAEKWRGHYAIASTTDEALAIIGAITNKNYITHTNERRSGH